MPTKTKKKTVTGAQAQFDFLLWLDQVAADKSLSPVASRVAIRLARKFGEEDRPIAALLDDVAALCSVSKNTAMRSLAALRKNGHLMAKSGGPGRILAFSPRIVGE